MYKNAPISWITVLFMAIFHTAAVAAFFTPFALKYVPIMIGVYLWIGFSTTLYLHRCMTHRALELKGWLKFFFFLGNAVGQQGDVVGWVGHHRAHHAHSDREQDIHSPTQGLWYSHMGWVLANGVETDEKHRNYAKDIREKYWYARLGENPTLFFLPHIAMAVTLYLTLGLPGLLWCLYVPMVCLYHATWSVNSLCHMPQFGYRTTETNDRSRNFWLVGLIGLGEGWHNNHHACQTRAPQGIEWYEIDATKYLIWVLEKTGLAWNVRWHAPVRSVTEPVLTPELSGSPAV